MSTNVLDGHQAVPRSPRGHVIGFVNTREQSDALVQALRDLDIHDDRILVLHDDSGWQDFQRMMKSSLWGEEAERILEEGEKELRNGHFVICVQAKDRDEGLVIAKLGQSQGGFGFGHFGILTDERMTR